MKGLGAESAQITDSLGSLIPCRQACLHVQTVLQTGADRMQTGAVKLFREACEWYMRRSVRRNFIIGLRSPHHYPTTIR